MSVTTRSMSKRLLIQADENENPLERRGRKRKHDGDDTIHPLLIQDSPHPLLNDLVLETLFKYVQRKDLLACRLVCQKWNVMSLPFVRSKLWIGIKEHWSSEHTGGMEDFMKMIRPNTLALGIPFEKFLLDGFDATKRAELEFIQICGPIAKQIILKSIAPEVKYDVQSVSKLLRSTPNLVSFTTPIHFSSIGKWDKIVKLFDNRKRKPTLKFLKFLEVGRVWPCKSFRSFDTKNICPTFYEELFEVSPNISTLRSNDRENSLDILKMIEKLGRGKTIENISLPTLTEEYLSLFRSMSSELNLKQLELRNIRLDNETKEFHILELLKMFKNTLIALRLNFYQDPRDSQIPVVITFIDQMPKLRFLELKLNRKVSSKCEDFNTIFPALEKIDTEFDIINHDGGDEPCSIPTLKSSIIRCVPITMPRLERILRIFPTLTVLKCTVRDGDVAEVIRNIWTRMTQLEGLEIFGAVGEAVDIDSLFTGIPAKEIKEDMKMKDFFKSLEPLEIEDRRQKISVERNRYVSQDLGLPSIRNLTNLRSLKLELIDDNCLTDATGYFALHSLNNLQHLNISKSEISQSCAQILVRDKNLLAWKFVSTHYRDIIPKSWEENISYSQDQDNFVKFPLLKV